MRPYNDTTTRPGWGGWEQAVVAMSRGATSRSCGESSVGNPYLFPDGLPAVTGQAFSTWFNNCDAWWRGWDREDERCRVAEAGCAAVRPAARARRRFDA